MTLTDYDDFKRKTETDQLTSYWLTVTSGAAGTIMQTWRTAPSSGTVPATYRTCESTTAGNLWQWDLNPNRGSTFYLAEAAIESNLAANSFGLIVDRLADQTGLVFNVGASQATNLPLTINRSVDGLGVMAGLVCWTSAASSAMTATITYVNQAGTSGRVSQPITCNAMQADQIKIFPLSTGDTGITAIDWFTVSSSMAAAGVYGLVLFKPLAVIPLPVVAAPMLPEVVPRYRNMLIGGGGNLASVASSGCLDLFVINAGTTAMTLYGRTSWIEA